MEWNISAAAKPLENAYGEKHFSIHVFAICILTTRCHQILHAGPRSWHLEAPGPSQVGNGLITYSNCFIGLFIWSGAQLTNWNIIQKAKVNALGPYLQWCESETTTDQSSWSRKQVPLSKHLWWENTTYSDTFLQKGCNLKQADFYHICLVTFFFFFFNK